MADLMYHDFGGTGAGAVIAAPATYIYAAVRRLVAEIIAARNFDGELQPAALVHDAWMRCASVNERTPEGRRHFLAVAAGALRRLFVECAREHHAQVGLASPQAGSDMQPRLPLPMPAADLIALDEALQGLARVDRPAAEIVNLTFFMGLTLPETARSLGASVRMVQRRWAFARGWVFNELQRRRSRSLGSSEGLGAVAGNPAPPG